MSISDFEITQESIGEFYRPRVDEYVIQRFTEAENPFLAVEAWKMHFQGYHDMGFVLESAANEHGYLPDDIDKSRGPDTDYYIANRPENPSDAATMRKINVPEGATFEVLPAFGLCKDSLSPDGADKLDWLRKNGADVKELAALARTVNSSPLGAHELFREVIQPAEGTNEVWLSTIVSTTKDALVRSFGSRNFIVIGPDVTLDDERVGKHIQLTPLIIPAGNFIENIAADYSDAVHGGNLLAARMLQRSLIFLTDGLTNDQMSPAVLAQVSGILSQNK